MRATSRHPRHRLNTQLDHDVEVEVEVEVELHTAELDAITSLTA